MKIPTADDLRDPNKFAGNDAYCKALREARDAHYRELQALIEKQKQGELLASERRAFDLHERECRDLTTLHDNNRVDRSVIYSLGEGRSAFEPGEPLRPEQRMEQFARATEPHAEHREGLRLSRMIRGATIGDWTGAENERRAMSEGVLSSGGFAVPSVLAGAIIDMARPRTAVLAAGARVVPMSSRTLDIARWEGDPSAQWHSEAATIAATDAVLGRVTLTAQTLTSLVITSRELLEDADGVEQELRQAFAAKFAAVVDRAALLGSGVAPEPRGVKNTANIVTASMGTNGAALQSFDPLVDLVGQLQDNNETPTGIIYAPRSERSVSKLKDSTGQPLRAPALLDGLPRYSTTQVPTNSTQGTSSAASDIFVGDWSQLVLGVRAELSVKVLEERYADTGQLGLLAWWRGDVVVTRPKAFGVLSGVL